MRNVALRGNVVKEGTLSRPSERRNKLKTIGAGDRQLSVVVSMTMMFPAPLPTIVVPLAIPTAAVSTPTIRSGWRSIHNAVPLLDHRRSVRLLIVHPEV